ncbi:MAG: alkaline phosphatase [Pseudomonadota bacterium]
MRLAFSLAAVALCTACSTPPPIDAPETVDLGRVATTPSQAGDAYYAAAKTVMDARAEARGVEPAKNVILFVGDGMGVSTITAGRIYAGQKRGLDGESYRLAMETLPWSALSKTYAHDAQVSDSAATATAMVAGMKTNARMVGVTREAAFSNCASAQGRGSDNLFELAEAQGLATGVVTTTRLTHATPASVYAEAPNRNWEHDRDVGGSACPDIASQLIGWPAGDGLEIALGGGREKFLPVETRDPEYADQLGGRGDARDLGAEWAAKSDAHETVYDLAALRAVDIAGGARVLGLFEPSHMKYEADRGEDPAGEPSLEEMTRLAISRLQQDEDGFVLMVEGGRIDHAHHGGNAYRALEDLDAFDQAVAAALEMTSAEDTLIIVTADHSHTLTIQGYQTRNNPILGKAAFGPGALARAGDGKPYTTLSYANGPGAVCAGAEDACPARPDLSEVDTEARDFRQQALIPAGSETHAGEDVAIFARGPSAHLVSGVMEQNEIFHVMAKAAGLIE